MLDYCCSDYGIKAIDWLLQNWTKGYSYIILGAIVVVAIQALINWVRSMAKMSGFSIVVDPEKSSGMTAVRLTGGGQSVEEVAVEGFDRGFHLVQAPDALLRSTDATGSGRPASVGYDIEDSPRAKLNGAVSRNNDTGFRVRGSEDADLSDTTAEGRTEPRAARKIYTVRLPEGMKGKTNDEE